MKRCSPLRGDDFVRLHVSLDSAVKATPPAPQRESNRGTYRGQHRSRNTPPPTRGYCARRTRAPKRGATHKKGGVGTRAGPVLRRTMTGMAVPQRAQNDRSGALVPRNREAQSAEQIIGYSGEHHPTRVRRRQTYTCATHAGMDRRRHHLAQRLPGPQGKMDRDNHPGRRRRAPPHGLNPVDDQRRQATLSGPGDESGRGSDDKPAGARTHQRLVSTPAIPHRAPGVGHP